MEHVREELHEDHTSKTAAYLGLRVYAQDTCNCDVSAMDLAWQLMAAEDSGSFNSIKFVMQFDPVLQCTHASVTCACCGALWSSVRF